jgi:hypothetical protein
MYATLASVPITLLPRCGTHIIFLNSNDSMDNMYSYKPVTCARFSHRLRDSIATHCYHLQLRTTFNDVIKGCDQTWPYQARALQTQPIYHWACSHQWHCHYSSWCPNNWMFHSIHWLGECMLMIGLLDSYLLWDSMRHVLSCLISIQSSLKLDHNF